MRAKTGCGGPKKALKKGPTKKKSKKISPQRNILRRWSAFSFLKCKKKKKNELRWPTKKAKMRVKTGCGGRKKGPKKNEKIIKFKVSPPRNILMRWSAFNF